jgi:transposase
VAKPLTNEDGGFKMNASIVGIDIAKNVFQLHGVDKAGKIVFKKRVYRDDLMKLVAKLAPCIIAMEACSGSNYWSRKFIALGHTVKLISPQYVKPYVKTNKNDAHDAEAICEAASRPHMRFVSPKNLEQQSIQSIHRIRERLISNRTALVNQIRGFLAEHGIVVAKGITKIRKQLPQILEEENELTSIDRELIYDLYEELRTADKKIECYDNKLEIIFNNNEACQQLAEIEGIGVISATALVASIGDANNFKNGRQMSAWLGLTPKQHSSGNKQVLLGISKRGDCYLRKLLVHGARSVVYRASKKKDIRSKWINDLVDRRGTNKTCVAVANKNVRIVWSMLVNDTAYRKAV